MTATSPALCTPTLVWLQSNQLVSLLTNPAGLRSVRSLYLSDNNLTGHMGDHLAGTRSLTDLQMSDNV